ncbi:hypothetical protein [Streptomyces sp. NPDC090445]|uniref:hypothetical protein n=1 Tax=Streptomyces sp. NPDC090445 TaxID=3365963 RepID=UPI0037F2ED68
MRLRTLAAAACGTALALGIAATPAHAGEAGPACGYEVCLGTTNGSATLYFDRYGGSTWQVCDDAPDGKRAIAEVRSPSGQVLRLQAAGGYGTCSTQQTLYPAPAGGSAVSLKVWVQNGSNGSPQYTRYGTYRW